MDAYRFDLRSTSATHAEGAAVLGVETLRQPTIERTLRMDMGGLCHLCGRKAARRVEMHTPLWQDGPIMYGECCLGRAEASLRAEPFEAHIPSAPLAPAAPATAASARDASGEQSGVVPRTVWLTFAAAAGLAILAIGVERLLHVALPSF